VLYDLLYSLREAVGWLSWLNVLRYTSTRILLATFTALILSLVLYPWFIRTLQKIQLGQVVRDDGPQSHFSKRGTPTMGGSLILFTLIIPTLLWSDLSNRFVLLATAVTAGYGVIGFIDDALKVRRKSSAGMPGRIKFLAQVVIAAAAVGYLYLGSDMMPEAFRYRLALPLLNFYTYDLVLPAAVYIALATTVIVGASNAVNLTDGLDGLAIMPRGARRRHLPGPHLRRRHLDRRLRHRPLPQHPRTSPTSASSRSTAEPCAAPASASSGTTPSLPASSWATSAPCRSAPASASSPSPPRTSSRSSSSAGSSCSRPCRVIVQVVSFKLTGKRVFKMAPIHHHFELKGWSEPKVVVRFWIISFMLALAGLATLKLR
jgi:phospho-N-acetylmuramoyl-pentapeptide-transferase